MSPSTGTPGGFLALLASACKTKASKKVCSCGCSTTSGLCSIRWVLHSCDRKSPFFQATACIPFRWLGRLCRLSAASAQLSIVACCHLCRSGQQECEDSLPRPGQCRQDDAAAHAQGRAPLAAQPHAASECAAPQHLSTCVLLLSLHTALRGKPRSRRKNLSSTRVVTRKIRSSPNCCQLSQARSADAAVARLLIAVHHFLALFSRSVRGALDCEDQVPHV